MTRPTLPPDTEWVSPGYMGRAEFDPALILTAPGQVAPPPLSATPDALVGAAGDVITGAMIALVPSGADLDRLAVEGGEARGTLHLTLFYLGEAVDYSGPEREALAAILRNLFTGFGPIETVAFGANYWNPAGPQPSWVLAVGDGPDSPGTLHDARESAELAIEAAGVREHVPAQHTPWIAHVCLAYEAPDVQDSTRLNDLIARLGPITFDTARLAFAGETTDIPMAGR